jgi:hypothetical protein
MTERKTTMKHKAIMVILTFFALVVLSSCAANNYKLYEGTNMPPDKVAILTKATESGVYLALVDGYRPPDRPHFYGDEWGSNYRIELLPGKHTLSFYYIHGYHESKQNIDVTFYAEPGKTYASKSSTVKFKSWKAWVEEVPPVKQQ